VPLRHGIAFLRLKIYRKIIFNKNIISYLLKEGNRKLGIGMKERENGGVGKEKGKEKGYHKSSSASVIAFFG
jgi:hypothetical protein